MLSQSKHCVSSKYGANPLLDLSFSGFLPLSVFFYEKVPLSLVFISKDCFEDLLSWFNLHFFYKIMQFSCKDIL